MSPCSKEKVQLFTWALASTRWTKQGVGRHCLEYTWQAELASAWSLALFWCTKIVFNYGHLHYGTLAIRIVNKRRVNTCCFLYWKSYAVIRSVEIVLYFIAYYWKKLLRETYSCKLKNSMDISLVFEKTKILCC